MKKILILVSIKFIILLLVSYFIKLSFVSVNNFSFPDELRTYGVPQFLSAFANFDGIHYIKIARGEYYEFAQVFFPLFPLIIMLISKAIGSHLIAGILISNLCFVVGLYLLLKLLEELKFKDKWWIVFLVVAFPTSFFFQMVYTESLFFMLLMIFLFSLKRGRVIAAAIAGIFAALTRFIGFFLIIPFIINVISRKKSKPKDFLVALLPGIGSLLYMLFLKINTGDPFVFFHAQSAFGAGRSTNLILFPQVLYRYIKIFLTASFNWTYVTAMCEFIFFTTFLLIILYELYYWWKRKNWFYIGLAAFSLINILLPTATGTLLSMPRFAIISISFFLFLGRQIISIYWRALLIVTFSLLQTVLVAAFFMGYFIS